jgi:hypothetical protein
MKPAHCSSVDCLFGALQSIMLPMCLTLHRFMGYFASYGVARGAPVWNLLVHHAITLLTEHLHSKMLKLRDYCAATAETGADAPTWNPATE